MERGLSNHLHDDISSSSQSVVYVVVQSHHVYARIPVLYVQVDFISFTGAAGAAAPRDADIIVCARPANVFTGGMWMCNWSPLYSCAGYTSSISGRHDDPIKWALLKFWHRSRHALSVVTTRVYFLRNGNTGRFRGWQGFHVLKSF